MSWDTIYKLEFDDSSMRECNSGDTIFTGTLSTIKTFKKTLQDSISVYYKLSFQWNQAQGECEKKSRV